MQEQSISDPQQKPATEEPREDLLLSPAEEAPKKESTEGALLFSLKEGPPDNLDNLKQSPEKLDESMLLSGPHDHNSEMIPIELKNGDSEIMDHPNPEVSIVSNSIMDNAGKEASLTTIKEQQSQRSKSNAFGGGGFRGDLSQFQTINQSDILKSSQVTSFIEKEKVDVFIKEKEDKIVPTNSEGIAEPSQPYSDRKEPQHRIAQDHSQQNNLPKAPQNIQERITNSQDKLLKLLHSSSDVFLEKKGLEMEPQEQKKSQNSIFHQNNESFLSESMVVNLSERKNQIQTASQNDNFFNKDKFNSGFRCRENEPMEIQNKESNEEHLKLSNQNHQYPDRESAEMEIEVPQKNQLQTQQKQEKCSIFSFGHPTQGFQSVFETENAEDKVEQNKSLPELQDVSESFPNIMNESRHFSLEVNVNQDSLPANLEPSFQSHQVVQKPETIENTKIRKEIEQEVPAGVLQEEISDSVQIPLSLVQAKINDQENREVHNENRERSENETSSQLIEAPYLSYKDEVECRYPFKTQNGQKSNERNAEVINQKNIQSSKKTSKSKDQGEAEKLKEIKAENNLDHSIEEIESSKTHHCSLPENEESPIQIAEQNNPQPEVQESNYHRIDSKEHTIVVQEPHDECSNKRQAQRKEVPGLHPSIIININRRHQISLNIFNNNPLPIQSDFPREPQPIKVNKAVQNEYTSTDENETILQENQKKDLEIKKKVNEKGAKGNLNSSIELQCEENRTKAQAEVQTQPCSFSYQEKQKNVPEYNPEGNIEEEYFKICDFADNYLLKQNSCQEEHLQFQNLIQRHLTRRISTEPISPLGHLLFKNGLFLVSLVKLFTKDSNTPFLSNYLFEYFTSAFKIENNLFIFQDTARKAKEAYVEYVDQKYQKDIFEKRQQEKIQINQEQVVRRSELKLPQHIQEKPTEHKPKNLTLSSNHFSISQKVACPKKQQSKIIEDKPCIRSSIQKENKLQDKVLQMKKQKETRESQLGWQKPRQRENSGKNKKPEERVDEKQAPKENLNKEKIKIEDSIPTDSANASNPRGENTTDLAQNSNFRSQDIPQNMNQKYAKLFEKYKQVRDTVRTSTSRRQENQGILKNGSDSKERDGDSELKKKKVVQFIQTTVEEKEVSKEVSQEEEEDYVEVRPKKKKKTKTRSKGDHLFSGDNEVALRTRAVSKR